MKKRIISSLLILAMVLSVIVPTNALAKAKTKTITVPTEFYESDTFFAEFLAGLNYTTKESGKNTLIKVNSKDLSIFLKEYKKEINKMVKDITKTKEISKITLNKNYTKIKWVQAKEINKCTVDLAALYVTLTYYQLFNGVKFNKIDLDITVCDKKGNVIDHQKLSD